MDAYGVPMEHPPGHFDGDPVQRRLYVRGRRWQRTIRFLAGDTFVMLLLFWSGVGVPWFFEVLLAPFVVAALLSPMVDLFAIARTWRVLRRNKDLPHDPLYPWQDASRWAAGHLVASVVVVLSMAFGLLPG